MQFSQIAAIFTVATGVSALAIEQRTGGAGGNCNTDVVNVCAAKGSGKCSWSTKQQCEQSGGTSYSCSVTGLNILTCVNVLNCNSVSIPVSIPISIGSITL